MREVNHNLKKELFIWLSDEGIDGCEVMVCSYKIIIQMKPELSSIFILMGILLSNLLKLLKWQVQIFQSRITELDYMIFLVVCLTSLVLHQPWYTQHHLFNLVDPFCNI